MLNNAVEGNWEEAIRQVVLQSLHKPFGLIDDPDQILSGNVISGMIDHGIELVRTADALALRDEYERRFRVGDADLAAKTLFIPHFQIDQAPFDILQAGIIIRLSLQAFFPKLSYNILRDLPASWRPVIFNNLKPLHKPQNDFQTANFVLQHCLGLDIPDRLDWAQAFSLLADIVLHQVELPRVLQTQMITNIPEQEFPNYSDLLASHNQANSFLKEVWESYIIMITQPSHSLREAPTTPALRAVDTLASNRELQTKMTALVAENLIPPATIQEPKNLPSWIHKELHFYGNQEYAVSEKLNYLGDHIPSVAASFAEWGDVANQWARWNVDYYTLKNPTKKFEDQRTEIHKVIEDRFADWLYNRYAALLQDAYLPWPTCGNRVLNYLSSQHKPSINNPVALVILDGMSLEDWAIIRSAWEKQTHTWVIEEKTVISIVPTITSVSRQTILSGKLPYHYPKHWLSTQREESLWQDYWEAQGLHPNTIHYQRGLGLNKAHSPEYQLEIKLEKTLKEPHIAVAALIVNTIDEMVHANLLGTAALHAQVRYWAEQDKYLYNFVNRLLERFSTIIITSDHGHVEGLGIGELPKSSLAEERAIRAHIYKGFEQDFEGSSEILRWHETGLPDNISIYIPKGLGMFNKSGVRGISHGGISLEEVVVPFITLTRQYK